jgi:signal transduction histidine kinase
MSDRGQTVHPEGGVGVGDFAAAQSEPRAGVEASIDALSGHPVVRALLDAADASVVVLNRQWQIVFGSPTLLADLGVEGLDLIKGMRPGQALRCVRAGTLGGCGTSPQCAHCGVLLAVLESQGTGGPAERECLMTVRRGDVMEGIELRVRALQITVGHESFTVLGLRDISAEKRREALERVFLHDVANTLSPLVTWSELLTRAPDRDPGEVARRIAMLARRVQRDVEDQRVLLQAEKGTLALNRAPVHPQAILTAAASILEGDPVAAGRRIEIVPCDRLGVLLTDESLLVRVLVNMLKNALEATPSEGRVSAWAVETADGYQFHVWNAGAIASEAALQIFNRSFSTKSERGRGLGTFSMKLFGERYLGGTVGFSSNERDGTTFSIRLPKGT